MTRLLSVGVLLAAVVLIGLALSPAPSPACAPAPQPGEYVNISEETALIIWDEATKTEHFIRRATFQSTSPDFGFLVPTPSQPDLGESDPAAYTQLAAVTAPKVEYRTVRRPRPQPQSDADLPMAPKMAAGGGVGATPPPGRVEVLEQTEVGGLEAVVLAFRKGKGDTDPAAGAKQLADWLKTRGYEFGPTLTDWLKPYVANDWVVTAFRVAHRIPVSHGPGGPPVTADLSDAKGKLVRMSFKTDRPFYPYREPAAEQSKMPVPSWVTPQRFLRVYFVSDKRYDGTLGDGPTPWPGKPAWAGPLSAEQVKDMAAKVELPDGSKLVSAWLTEFEDRSSPRPGTDEVYFAPAKSQETLARPPVVHEVVEYYDEPDGASGRAAPAMGVGVFAVAVGIGLAGLVIGLIVYWAVVRK